MKTVRCKMKCRHIGIQDAGNESVTHSVTFDAVYGNGDPNHENTTFWKYTPSGSLVLSTINPQDFKVGDEYYIDITLAPKAVPNAA